MNLGEATFLVAVITGMVTLARSFVFGTSRERVVGGIVLAIAIGSVFLVSASDWAHEQIVVGKPLDEVSVASRFCIAFVLAGGASTLWQVLGAVRNIGENQPAGGTANTAPPLPTASDFKTP